MSDKHPDLLRRIVLGASIALVYGVLCWHPQWMANLGVSHVGIWFLDTRGVLAASDASALGMNPYAPNPLDLLHQPHVYSGWWLLLHHVGLTREDYMWLGSLLGFSFLAVALLQAGVRTWREVIWSALLICAPPMILGFNRGNADLLVFIVLAAVAPCLASRQGWIGWLGVAAIVFAAGLKFYPAVAGLVLLAPLRDLRTITLQCAIVALSFVAVVASHWAMLSAYAADRMIPHAFQMFGLNVPAQLLQWPTATPVLIVGFAVLVIAALRAPAWDEEQLVRPNTLRFVVGASVVVGSYFVTVSYSYRLIFALLAAPFLWSASIDGIHPLYYQRLARTAAVLMAMSLWFNGLARIVLAILHPSPAHNRVLMTPVVALEQPIMIGLTAALLALLAPWTRDCLRRLRLYPEPCR